MSGIHVHQIVTAVVKIGSLAVLRPREATCLSVRRLVGGTVNASICVRAGRNPKRLSITGEDIVLRIARSGQVEELIPAMFVLARVTLPKDQLATVVVLDRPAGR